MDLADWLRSLGLERYEAAHIEPVSRKPNGHTPDPVTDALRFDLQGLWVSR